MKKRFAFIIALVAVLFAVASCGGNKCEHVDADDNLKCDLCGETYDDGKEEPKPYEFKTPVTDSLKLTQSYEGKDFIKDGIGLATVVAFTDGDTAIFRTAAGQKITVRFLGIDTPESTYRVDPWGFAASAHTKNALKNAKEIVLQAETLDDKLRLDSTGKRYLAWVWVDGRLLNLEVAEVGLGTADASDTQYNSQFISAIQGVLKARERIYGTNNDPSYDYTNNRETITIKELRERYSTAEAITTQLDVGKKIRITGTVAKKFGSGCAYIQQYDEDGNYYGIYAYGGYSSIAAFGEGITITLDGTIGYHYGQLQITSINETSIVVHSFSNKDAVVATEVKAEDLSIHNGLIQGNLITINEEIEIIGYRDSEENNAFSLKTNYKLSDGNYLEIRVDQNIALKGEDGKRIKTGAGFVGKTITSITCIASYYDPNTGTQNPEEYDGYLQLMWATYSDVTFK